MCVDSEDLPLQRRPISAATEPGGPPFEDAEQLRPVHLLLEPDVEASCLASRMHPPMPDWFARPVLHVTDVEASLGFYVHQLGFTSPWRYDEDGSARVRTGRAAGLHTDASRPHPS